MVYKILNPPEESNLLPVLLCEYENGTVRVPGNLRITASLVKSACQKRGYSTPFFTSYVSYLMYLDLPVRRIFLYLRAAAYIMF